MPAVGLGAIAQLHTPKPTDGIPWVCRDGDRNMETGPSSAESTSLSPARGRFYIFTAALLWSTSGASTTVLTQETALGLNQPPVDAYPVGDVNVPVQIACYRVLAMALGTAANAIVLQYTAPMWMFLASVFLLREPADRRNVVALLMGL